MLNENLNPNENLKAMKAVVCKLRLDGWMDTWKSSSKKIIKYKIERECIATRGEFGCKTMLHKRFLVGDCCEAVQNIRRDKANCTLLTY